MEKAGGRRIYVRKSGKKAELGEREKRRLIQLAVCLVLFLTVFLAKGADKLGVLRSNLAEAIRADTDFRTAFTDLGWSIASGQPVKDTLQTLWVDVFLPREQADSSDRAGGYLYQETLTALQSEEGRAALADPGRREASEATAPMSQSVSRDQTEKSGEQDPASEHVSVVHVEYNGPALPANATMDRYDLGLEETVSPVLGTVASDFGWREHPIDGGEKFHSGVDLGVEIGTEVKAFAAGKVDYIGESETYGQYLQLRHDNGVTTFYAHCSKLCVQQGQTVAAGEKVAESGATGKVTGPHLHFELKKDGIWLEPLYYIQTLS